MKGDQSLEMTTYNRTLSYALSKHFTEDNCCGVLDCAARIDDCYPGTTVMYETIYQFVCKKCYRIIQIDETQQS